MPVITMHAWAAMDSLLVWRMCGTQSCSKVAASCVYKGNSKLPSILIDQWRVTELEQCCLSPVQLSCTYIELWLLCHWVFTCRFRWVPYSHVPRLSSAPHPAGHWVEPENKAVFLCFPKIKLGNMVFSQWYVQVNWEAKRSHNTFFMYITRML